MWCTYSALRKLSEQHTWECSRNMGLSTNLEFIFWYQGRREWGSMQGHWSWIRMISPSTRRELGCVCGTPRLKSSNLLDLKLWHLSGGLNDCYDIPYLGYIPEILLQSKEPETLFLPLNGTLFSIWSAQHITLIWWKSPENLIEHFRNIWRILE